MADNKTFSVEKSGVDAGLTSGKAWMKLIIAVLLSGIIIFSQAVSMTLFSEMNIPKLFMTAAGEAVPMVLSILLMICLGGRKWLGIDKNSMKYAFRVGWVFPAFGLVLSILRTISSIRSGTSLAQGVLVNLTGVIIASLFIGIYEEVLYRGISFGTLLGVLGGSKTTILLAVLFSSWSFGRVHVSSMNFGDPLLFAQSILKIVQTGMMGVVMCDIMMHTRKIGGAAMLHFANDCLLMLTGALFEGSTVTGQYVVADEGTGRMVILSYLLMIAVYLYPTIASIRRIWKEHDKCYGPFVKTENIKSEI